MIDNSSDVILKNLQSKKSEMARKKIRKIRKRRQSRTKWPPIPGSTNRIWPTNLPSRRILGSPGAATGALPSAVFVNSVWQRRSGDRIVWACVSSPMPAKAAEAERPPRGAETPSNTVWRHPGRLGIGSNVMARGRLIQACQPRPVPPRMPSASSRSRLDVFCFSLILACQFWVRAVWCRSERPDRAQYEPP